jgi:hypothetical protein
MQRMPETGTEAVEIFRKWINQRSGIDSRNYFSDWRDQDGRRAFRQEQQSIQADGDRARVALSEFSQMPYDPVVLADACRHAYSGRLDFNARAELTYTTGQYFPTEYRKAAASVLEQYVSDMRRKGIGIPADAQKQHGETITVSELKAINAGHGGHFFDADAMRFFNSKVHGPVYTGTDGWYFVTSERNDGAFGSPSNPRKYTVRRMDKEGDISEPEEDGHDNFQRHDTLKYAQTVARKLAERSVMLANAYAEAGGKVAG